MTTKSCGQELCSVSPGGERLEECPNLPIGGERLEECPNLPIGGERLEECPNLPIGGERLEECPNLPMTCSACLRSWNCCSLWLLTNKHVSSSLYTGTTPDDTQS